MPFPILSFSVSFPAFHVFNIFTAPFLQGGKDGTKLFPNFRQRIFYPRRNGFILPPLNNTAVNKRFQLDRKRGVSHFRHKPLKLVKLDGTISKIMQYQHRPFPQNKALLPWQMKSTRILIFYLLECRDLPCFGDFCVLSKIHIKSAKCDTLCKIRQIKAKCNSQS